VPLLFFRLSGDHHTSLPPWITISVFFLNKIKWYKFLKIKSIRHDHVLSHLVLRKINTHDIFLQNDDIFWKTVSGFCI
jgi:hypothetical protein